METILLGTEGDQPFKITQSGVSRQHARIIIDDNRRWTLEDLNSTNGTFVRSEDGELRRISKVAIEPMTFICLGPDNANGCSFYARHVKESNNYIPEFQYLNEIEDKYDRLLNRANSITRTSRIITALASLIGLVGSFMIPKDFPNLRLNFIRMGSAVSALCTLLIDPSKKIKSIQAERDKFHRCPNPKCSHTLKTSEIRDMQCAKCKCK